MSVNNSNNLKFSSIMLNKDIIFRIICFFHTFLSVTSNLIVTTTTGPVRGKINHYGKTSYISYEGIPFAQPPIGDLRFRPPVPVKPWKHIFDATAPGPVCPQSEARYRRSEMDENCLFLNIYVPVTASHASFPVIFFIHGGYYIVNSGKTTPIYGPQLLLEKDIIVVTTNYRLGALGFLSFGNIDASGNAGLKDIILASKWIKDNIEKFKGNCNQISLLGTGVGGALAHFILLTNQTSGIFSSANIYSGSAISYRALQINPKDNALKLAQKLGIKYFDHRCLKKLKKIDPFEIVDAELDIIRNDPRRAFVLVNFFSPSIENPSSIAIITRNPLDIIRSEGLIQKIPIITGFNNQEGLEIFSVIRNDPTIVDTLNENFELCIPSNIQYPLGSKERKDLAKSIREFYFNGGNINIFNTQNYINLITDTAYAYSIDYWINLYKRQKCSSPVYYYYFQFDGQLNWGKLLNGVTYPGAAFGDELGYIFLTNVTKNILQHVDNKTQMALENSLSLIKSFALCRNPTPNTQEGYQWTETGPNRNYLVIDEVITNVYEPPLPERLGFWYKEYDKYYAYERSNNLC